MIWNVSIKRTIRNTLKKIGFSPNTWKRFGIFDKATNSIQRLEKRFFRSTKPFKVLPLDARKKPWKVLQNWRIVFQAFGCNWMFFEIHRTLFRCSVKNLFFFRVKDSIMYQWYVRMISYRWYHIRMLCSMTQ
jgi:hypothetical protein